MHVLLHSPEIRHFMEYGESYFHIHILSTSWTIMLVVHVTRLFTWTVILLTSTGSIHMLLSMT